MVWLRRLFIVEKNPCRGIEHVNTIYEALWRLANDLVGTCATWGYALLRHHFLGRFFMKARGKTNKDIICTNRKQRPVVSPATQRIQSQF
jgi:hypothetical protein